MRTRLELSDILLEILIDSGIRTADGDGHLYYQPPESVRMKYPAIVYKRNQIQNRFADNQVYLQTDEYQITVVDKDPDSPLVRRISRLPRCRHIRHFTSENLNHDVFNITC